LYTKCPSQKNGLLLKLNEIPDLLFDKQDGTKIQQLSFIRPYGN